MILVVTLDMALHNPFREASRLLREQLLLSVPMTVTAVHQTPTAVLRDPSSGDLSR